MYSRYIIYPQYNEGTVYTPSILYTDGMYTLGIKYTRSIIYTFCIYTAGIKYTHSILRALFIPLVCNILTVHILSVHSIPTVYYTTSTLYTEIIKYTGSMYIYGFKYTASII